MLVGRPSRNTSSTGTRCINLIHDKAALLNLALPDPHAPGRMSDRVEAVRLLAARAGADLIVEGWVEGPCGAASDLRGINRLMIDFHDDPAFVRDLFEFVLQLAISFGRAQVEAGADVIGIGDPAASLTGPRVYDKFVWPFQKRLVGALHSSGALVRLHICGNTKRILAGMGRTGADVVDLDYLSPVAMARQAMGTEQVLLANISLTLSRG